MQAIPQFSAANVPGLAQLSVSPQQPMLLATAHPITTPNDLFFGRHLGLGQQMDAAIETINTTLDDAPRWNKRITLASTTDILQLVNLTSRQHPAIVLSAALAELRDKEKTIKVHFINQKNPEKVLEVLRNHIKEHKRLIGLMTAPIIGSVTPLLEDPASGLTVALLLSGASNAAALGISIDNEDRRIHKIVSRDYLTALQQIDRATPKTKNTCEKALRAFYKDLFAAGCKIVITPKAQSPRRQRLEQLKR